MPRQTKPLAPKSEPTDKDRNKSPRAVRVRCEDGPNRGAWIRTEVGDKETVYWMGNDAFYHVERVEDIRQWRCRHVELNGLGILFRNVANQ